MFKHISKNITITLMCLIALFSTMTTNASNRLYADNELEPTQGFDWDWSFGASHFIQDSYLISTDSFEQGLELDLNLAISYNKFYLDLDNTQISGTFLLGYSLIDKYDWGLDIIGTNFQKGFSESGYNYDDDIKPDLAGISTREYDFNIGMRLSRRFKDTQVSFELLKDISGAHDSWLFNSFISRIQIWKNWEFRTAAGINIYSEKFTQYYYGISPEEERSFRAQYRPDNGFSALIEFHAEYPLSEHWVFMSGILSTWFSGAIGNSPIITQSYQHKAKVGVRYVF
ncbi:MipA/OmpV family protein [Pseudoalteromonas denitrificans]|uniref:Outer membrane scaffolding protein for murein synthesis, MipA/OmpV family n=1 Tax=Pseudoalteromonas denitrificans DSM 6059 TaxID=1123010 RepID=A0A1I1EWG0_9GAMM|nr:MipA/OmpV family protein [Pseudoalteromonas denitrificans]SFB91519.1 Outer membrane scaffolding protein for murein synthesis, MipA/OmpV family [Pseudoalteromonas denitrificans DSM 6059]